MISGMHVILYSRHVEEVRRFLSERLRLYSIDAGRGWGLLTSIVLPGGERIGLYEPRHPSPIVPSSR